MAIPAEGMFTPEPWRQRPLLKRVVDGGGLFEHSSQRHSHPSPNLGQEYGPGECLVSGGPGRVVVVGRQRVHLNVVAWNKVTIMLYF